MSGKAIVPPRFMTQPHAAGEVGGIYWCTISAPIYGAINGYVRVPAGHPWHRCEYHEVNTDVHGGLTFAAMGDDGSKWFGFDTMHFLDYWPGMPDFMAEPPAHHWTADEVAAEAPGWPGRQPRPPTTSTTTSRNWNRDRRGNR